MRDDWTPTSGEQYANFLIELRGRRRQIKESLKNEKAPRVRLTQTQREEILNKTGKKCHICGGTITDRWEADHVLSHSKGGGHSVDNYLAAHPTCNNYRWDYMPEEFQEIMKLGIWMRTQIERNTKIGATAAEKFVRYEANRISRRKKAKNA
jgi:hypothetical protein